MKLFHWNALGTECTYMHAIRWWWLQSLSPRSGLLRLWYAHLLWHRQPPKRDIDECKKKGEPSGVIGGDWEWEWACNWELGKMNYKLHVHSYCILQYNPFTYKLVECSLFDLASFAWEIVFFTRNKVIIIHLFLSFVRNYLLSFYFS